MGFFFGIALRSSLPWPKNVRIPQLAVHRNLQVAVLLIVLMFRLFVWDIVLGEFICCDPRSCVVAAKGHLT